MSRKILAVLAFAGLTGLIGWLAWPARAPDAQPAPAEVAAPVVTESVSLVESPALPSPPPLQTGALDIRRRDTVSGVLVRHEIAPKMAHAITTALRDAGVNLRRVRPGDRLELSRTADGTPAAVTYAASPWLRFTATVVDDDWQAERIELTPEVRVEVRHGEITNSLWDVVESGAVAPQLMVDLVQIFESEFDFTADTRPGDQLRLLVEARYADGVLVDYGRIVAAQYQSDGRTLTGVGFEGEKRFTYYDPEGQSLKKMFLRSPLRFTRISSGFTYRRPHPILGGVRPHLAIDYAAPKGTPVWAVADGVVRVAGRRGGNGIQVILRHRAGYDTYYNHLSRVAKGIRPGVRVSQKQVIGYVGSTGLSTGPHLDYRVSKNGKFVNPLNERFLPGEPIPRAQRAGFVDKARELVERLEREAPFPL